MYRKYKVSIVGIFVLFFALFASSSSTKKWLLDIDGKTAFSIDDFKEEFEAFVDLQTIPQILIDDKTLREAKENKANKKAYLENAINDLLIIKYAKAKGIYKEKDVERRLKAINVVLRKQMIKNHYINKVILPKVKKPDKDLVRDIYNKLKKTKEAKGLSALEIRDIAKKRATMDAIKRAFVLSINDLRSKHRIKLNDNYDNVFE